MKRTYFLVPAVMLSIAAAQPGAAQESATAIGLRGGLNFAKFSAPTSEFDSRTGFAAGAFFARKFSELWGAGAEVLYTQKGFKDDFAGIGPGGQPISAERNVSLSYLEVQVPIVIYPSTGTGRLRPRLYAGPYAALEVGCNFTLESTAETVDTSCDNDPGRSIRSKSFDYGVLLGVGVDLNAAGNGLSLDLRYALGVANVNDETPAEELHNRVVQLMVGFNYTLSR